MGNAWHQQWKDQQWSRVIKIEGNEGLVSAFEKETVLLIAFTNHWCTRCLLLRPEFEVAANLLSTSTTRLTFNSSSASASCPFRWARSSTTVASAAILWAARRATR